MGTTYSVTRPRWRGKLVPFEEQRPGLVGSMRGTVLWYGDLISPVDVEWDADK